MESSRIPCAAIGTRVPCVAPLIPGASALFQAIRWLAWLWLLPAALTAQVNITTQPQPVIALAGQPATFSVTVAPGGTPTYQWRRNGYALPGATRTSHTIAAVSQGDNDLYDVVVTSGGAATTSQPARLLVTLPAYPNAITTDLARSMRLEGQVGGQLTAHAALPDGRYYVAGTFSTVNNQARSDIARFNVDGTLDTTFKPPVFDECPRSLALQPDGKLVAGGAFTTVGGVPTRGIVRLNADGSRDVTFVVGAGFSGTVESVFSAPSGAVYVHGFRLGSYLGSVEFSGIVRLTSTGGLDSTFTRTVFSSGGTESSASRIAIDPTGAIFATGPFTKVNATPRNGLVRLLPSGVVDPAFDPGSGPNDWVYGMAALSNGQLVLGGNFTSYNGTTVGRIVRLNPNGAIDPTFETGSGFTQTISLIAELPGNNLFVWAGTYSFFNKISVSNGVRLTPTGGLDRTFSSTVAIVRSASVLPNNRLLLIGATASSPIEYAIYLLEANGAVSSGNPAPTFRFKSRVRLLAHQPSGKIIVAGDFLYANGAAAPYIMRLNADLSRDPTFPNGPGPTSFVKTGVIQPDGKIVLLCNSGKMRLNADGSTDASFSTSASSLYDYPTAPVVLPDGRIFVTTRALTWDGMRVTNGFVILEPNGARATTHALLPGSPENTAVSGVGTLPNGGLLVTGSFVSWNGVSRANAVRLRLDGSVDTNFHVNPPLVLSHGYVGLTLAGPSLQRDGRLVAVAGERPTTLLRLNLDGSRDPGFGDARPLFVSPAQLLIQPDDRIVMHGQDSVVLGGTQYPSFARFTPDGAVDGSFFVSGSRYWYSVLLADNGELLSSDDSGYLHRYRPLPPPTIDAQPAGQSVASGSNTTFRVSAVGTPGLKYQWKKDGVSLAGATSSILVLNRVSTASAGGYTVVVTDAAGSTVSSTATLTVTAQPVAGAYFGTLGNNSGTFALFLRDNSTGTLLGYLRSPRGALVSQEVAVGGDRRFRFSTTATFENGTESKFTVEGSVGPDGALSGNLVELNLALVAAPPAPATAARSLAGFYQGGAAGAAATNYTIVGSAGGIYTLAVGGNTLDAAQGTLDAAGRLSATTERNVRLTATVETTGGQVSTVLTPATGAALTFRSANNDARTDSEKLVNLSTRSRVTAGGGNFTVGFFIAGDRPKSVLVRAIGPTLAAFQVGDALAAAKLEVFRGQTPVAAGNDWGAAANAPAIAAASARVGAFALAATSRDAALLLTLEPGAHTAVVSGQGGASGIALVEVYDATDGPIPRTQRIANLSALAAAGAGDDTLTAGFFISGTVPKRVLIRGAGPALTPFGVGNPLPRLQVAVYSGSTVLVQNSGWSSAGNGTAIANAAVQVGAFAFASGSQDAALLTYLAPGSYSAQVSGLDGASGTALVEIYEVR